MSSIIKSDNGVSSGVTGIVQTADSSGQLALQTTNSAGTAVTALTLNNSQQATFANTINVPNTFGFKNRIINGAMNVNQYNSGSVTITNTANATYVFDRWAGYGTVASKFSVQQTPSTTETGYATRVGAGFINYLAATSLAATTLGATDWYDIRQPIEGLNVTDLGWGTSSAKTVTLSFWAYSSLTGTFGGAIINSATTRSYPFSYSIPVANTWTQISVTIPGDTSGTWLTTNGVGVFVIWSLGSGSSKQGTAGAWSGTFYTAPTGAVNVVSTNTATFYLTGVQFEVGTQATSFDYRPYGTELALCQRYYFQLGGASGQRLAIGWWYNTTSPLGHMIYFPVCMRNPSSISLSYSSLSDFYVYTAATSITPTSITLVTADTNCLSIDLAVSSGGTAGQASGFIAQTTSARLKISNEL